MLKFGALLTALLLLTAIQLPAQDQHALQKLAEIERLLDLRQAFPERAPIKSNLRQPVVSQARRQAVLAHVNVNPFRADAKQRGHLVDDAAPAAARPSSRRSVAIRTSLVGASAGVDANITSQSISV